MTEQRTPYTSPIRARWRDRTTGLGFGFLEAPFNRAVAELACLQPSPPPSDDLEDDRLDEFFDRWGEVQIGARCGPFHWKQYPVAVLRALPPSLREPIVENAGSAEFVEARVSCLHAVDVAGMVAPPSAD